MGLCSQNVQKAKRGKYSTEGGWRLHVSLISIDAIADRNLMTCSVGWADWQDDFPTGKWHYRSFYCESDSGKRKDLLPGAGAVAKVDS